MRSTVLRRWGALLALVGCMVLATAATAMATRRDALCWARRTSRLTGRGFGTSHPRQIYNGGDANGSVSHIRWYSWGGHAALGVGKQPMFKPAGGYYKLPLLARLHAVARGRCYPGGPLAYTRLYVRSQTRPGGPFGRTYLWSGARSLCHGCP
jgi:hypothetical protein